MVALPLRDLQNDLQASKAPLLVGPPNRNRPRDLPGPGVPCEKKNVLITYHFMGPSAPKVPVRRGFQVSKSKFVEVDSARVDGSSA